MHRRPLANGTPVKVKTDLGKIVSGKIVGVFNSMLATSVGIGYIVQADDEADMGPEYNYPCFAAYEIMFVTDDPFHSASIRFEP